MFSLTKSKYGLEPRIEAIFHKLDQIGELNTRDPEFDNIAQKMMNSKKSVKIKLRQAAELFDKAYHHEVVFTGRKTRGGAVIEAVQELADIREQAISENFAFYRGEPAKHLFALYVFATKLIRAENHGKQIQTKHAEQTPAVEQSDDAEAKVK